MKPTGHQAKLHVASGTHFDWASAADISGADIQFSPVLDAINLFINGNRNPPFDFSNTITDISSYLRNGSNEVLVVAPTTM